MGLSHEIEEIFKDVLERDLERMSRSAEPSYHWPTTAPVSMFLMQRAATRSGNAVVSFVPQDYQVVRIELNPFRINPEELEDNLRSIKRRRRRRGVKRSCFEAELDAGSGDGVSADEKGKHLHEAYHKYIEETGAQNPIPIVPRELVVNDTTVDAPVITVAGVDYLLRTYAETKAKYDMVKDKVHIPPVANHDQWPEEIVIRQEQGDPLVYLRADLVDADGDGNPDFIKLEP